MGSPIQFLRAFPTQQQRELAAAFRLMRRRVDQSLTSVTLATNTTTTMATLTCPANELQEGSVMHVQIGGVITPDAGAAELATVSLLLNGTAIWSDAVTIGTGQNTDRSYLIDARIFWQSPTVVLLTGLIAFSPDLATAATGNGSLEVNAAAATEASITPIYHTLSSQVMARDQIITATMLLADGPVGTTKAASLWVE